MRQFFYSCMLLGAFIILSTRFTPAEAKSEINQAEAKAKIEQVMKRLKLSTKQKTAIRPIIKKSMEERGAIVQRAGLKKGQRPSFRQIRLLKSSMQALQRKTQGQLSKHLNSSQMAEYNKIRAENRARMRAKFLEK